MRAALQGPQTSTLGRDGQLYYELCAMRRGVEALLMVNKAMADIMWKGLLPLISQANERGDELLRARDDLVRAKDEINAATEALAEQLRAAR